MDAVLPRGGFGQESAWKFGRRLRLVCVWGTAANVGKAKTDRKPLADMASGRLGGDGGVVARQGEQRNFARLRFDGRGGAGADDPVGGSKPPPVLRRLRSDRGAGGLGVDH